MLKSTIDKWLGSEPPQEVEDKQPPAAPATLEAELLREVLASFKIGARIHYVPESGDGKEIESMILGYSINDRHVFAASDMGDPESDLILKRGGEGEVKIEAVRELLIILPRSDYASEDSGEGDVDPRSTGQVVERVSNRIVDRNKRKVKPRRNYTNDFPKGSMTTLKATSAIGGVPAMDCLVKNSTRLQEGVFVNQSVVFLEPRFDTLYKANRRNQYRVQTEIPVQTLIKKSDTHLACTLQNFSEKFFRIVPVNPDPVWPEMEVGDPLVIKIELPETDKRFILNSAITRWEAGSAVVELREILRGEKFVPISTLDQLEIKSALLEHPQSKSPDL